MTYRLSSVFINCNGEGVIYTVVSKRVKVQTVWQHGVEVDELFFKRCAIVSVMIVGEEKIFIDVQLV